MSSSPHPEDPAEETTEAAAMAPAEPVEPGDTTQITGLLPPTHWTELAEQVGIQVDRRLI